MDLEAIERLIRGTDRMINLVLGILLILILLYAGYALWDTYEVYHKTDVSDEIMCFKPSTEDASNPTLPELQAINPDVCAWLTLDDTNIDYPVLKGESNSEYLNKDIYGDYSLGGSIFLDYRNSEDFTDAYSLIYGHHMDGGAMFGDLAEYADRTFFDEHQTGWLFVTGMTYQLEIYAYLHVDAYSTSMFEVEIDKDGFATLLSYIQDEATYFRDIGVTADDRIAALSTCSSATTNGRTIIVAKMVEYVDAGGEQETK